jgi:hypothetical protein
MRNEFGAGARLSHSGHDRLPVAATDASRQIEAAANKVRSMVRNSKPHVRGISPRRLAMILSTIRFGSMPVIRCRIGSGVTW